jgi:hypothetical protein
MVIFVSWLLFSRGLFAVTLLAKRQRRKNREKGKEQKDSDAKIEKRGKSKKTATQKSRKGERAKIELLI